MSKTAKHTPGPWKHLPPNDVCRTHRVAAEQDTVAKLVLDNGHDEIAANARLIAAAPEMLEALKAFLAPHYDPDDDVIDPYTANAITAEDSGGTWQLKGTFLGRLERARALIAKAEGKS